MTLSRRQWLRSLLPSAVDAAAEVIEGQLRHYLRPPGAIREAAFLASCTRCLECVKACPHFSIFTLAAGAGLAAGTPVMAPGERPCHMCEGFPCAAACPEDAMEVPGGASWGLGSVHLITSSCFTFMGPECGACGGLCPGEVRAIRFVRQRPVVDSVACVGCGLCVEACPTNPKALVFVPKEVP